MTPPPEQAVRRRFALTLLAHRAGPFAGAEAIADAAGRAYDDLAGVLAAVIGDMGVSALTERALQLANEEYPWLIGPCEPGYASETFAQLLDTLKRQDRGVAADAVAAVFATLVGLLATFIGDALATRLVRQAWPDVVSSASPEET